jgi:hypothetical protein
LVNVSQQLGAAVGLAVLVTVFNSVAGHAQLVPGATPPASIHALRDVFVVAGLFAVGALLTVVFGVDRAARAESPVVAPATERDDELNLELAELSAAEGTGDLEGDLAEAALSA